MAKIDQPADSNVADDLDFDELFAGEKKMVAPPKPAQDDNLDELEAFLDAFEKDLDKEPAKPAPVAEVAAEPPSEAVPMNEVTADFTEPAQAEALVHGLLKEDDLNLDVGEAPVTEQAVPSVPLENAPKPQEDAAPLVEEPAEFEPAVNSTGALSGPALAAADAPAPPAFIEPAPARDRGKSAAETSRSSVAARTAAVFAVVALVVASASAWIAFSARSQAQAAAQQAAAAQQPVADPRVAVAMNEINALKQRMGEISALLEGPVGHVASAYPRDMEDLQNRLMDLRGALTALEEKLAGLQKTRPVVRSAPRAENRSGGTTAGGWVVNLASFSDSVAAERELKQARAAGMNVEIVPTAVGGRTWHRLTVPGFANANEARAYLAREGKAAGYHQGWVERRR